MKKFFSGWKFWVKHLTNQVPRSMSSISSDMPGKSISCLSVFLQQPRNSAWKYLTGYFSSKNPQNGKKTGKLKIKFEQKSHVVRGYFFRLTGCLDTAQRTARWARNLRPSFSVISVTSQKCPSSRKSWKFFQASFHRINSLAQILFSDEPSHL